MYASLSYANLTLEQNNSFYLVLVTIWGEARKGGMCSPILNLIVMYHVQIVPCLDAACAERV